MKHESQPSSFIVKSSGTIGQEIIGSDGTVICWTTDPWLAQVIAKLLTDADEFGILTQSTRKGE